VSKVLKEFKEFKVLLAQLVQQDLLVILVQQDLLGQE
jgi:hypothetical protein